jgi:myo-inositol-1(or 4)-monophosphatase
MQVLMVEEAGGFVTTMRGTAYNVFERSMLASNDRVHAALLETIEPATTALLDQGVDLSPWYIPEGYSLHGGRQLD